MRQALRKAASESDAIFLQRFFKTGQGEYGFGDQFLGVRVPATRKIVRQFSDASLAHALELLHSVWHEERLLALHVMVSLYAKGDETLRQSVYESYLGNTRYINNWDLVDTSAEHIVGPQLLVMRDPGNVLDTLAASSNLWERRIAVLATFHLVRHKQYQPTFRVAKQLLTDPHDLIHKAVGWMLREVGKRNVEAEKEFLDAHYQTMPRTMLRYAIEKFPEPLRQRYLKGTVRVPAP